MGEWSKHVGEVGEAVVAKLITLLGWGEHQTGVELPCGAPSEHARSGVEARRTHGIDMLFSYMSPLCDGVLDNLVISSKFTAEDYPSSPTTLFKSHFSDLTGTLHCFSRSEIRAVRMRTFSSVRTTRDFGILFWLNQVNPSADVISKVANAQFSHGHDRYLAVYLIDNKRASFLYDSLLFAKFLAPNDDITFAYIDTGKVLNPSKRVPSGKILPVEYTNLGILPLRIENTATKATRLMLFSMDNFEPEGLGRLIGLAQGLSQNWAGKIDICFPDYNRLVHEESARLVRNAFVDRNTTGQLDILSFRPDFTS